MRNDAAGVTKLLAAGADPYQTFTKRTPLQAAAYYGKTDGVRALLAYPVPPENTDREKANRIEAMNHAALGGKIASAALLLEHKVDYTHPTAIKHALNRRHYAMVEWLLDVDPACPIAIDPVHPPLPLLKRLIAGGAQVLTCYAGDHLGNCSDDLERLQFLYNLDRAFFHRPIDPRDCSTRVPAHRPIDTALRVAAGKGALEGVKFLLQEGAQVDHPANAMRAAAEGGEAIISPAYVYKAKEHQAVLQLLAQQATSNDIFVQVALGQTNAFTKAIAADPTLLQAQTEPHFGKSILHVAIEHKRTDSLRALLALGADPNLPDSYCDVRPLHLAAIRLETETVQLLLDHGAKPNVLTTGMVPTSPIHALIEIALTHAKEPPLQNKATAIAKLLLAHGASLDQPTPRIWRPHNGRPSVSEWIRDAGPEWMKAWLPPSKDPR